MKTVNEMFLGKYDLLVNYSVADRINYLEQNYTSLWNHAGIDYWQY